MYLVWSNEHMAWWKPGRMGYTVNVAEAGVYSRDEAMAIVNDATIVWRARKGIGIMYELPVRIADLPASIRERLSQDAFYPDWTLTSEEQVAVALTLAIPKHIPGWPGATDEQLEAVARDVLAQVSGG